MAGLLDEFEPRVGEELGCAIEVPERLVRVVRGLQEQHREVHSREAVRAAQEEVEVEHGVLDEEPRDRGRGARPRELGGDAVDFLVRQRHERERTAAPVVAVDPADRPRVGEHPDREGLVLEERELPVVVLEVHDRDRRLHPDVPPDPSGMRRRGLLRDDRAPVVAHEVEALDADRGEQAGEFLAELLDSEAGRRLAALAESLQVDGDDVALRREVRDLVMPRPPGLGQPVHEDDRRTAPVACLDPVPRDAVDVGEVVADPYPVDDFLPGRDQARTGAGRGVAAAGGHRVGEGDQENEGPEEGVHGRPGYDCGRGPGKPRRRRARQGTAAARAPARLAETPSPVSAIQSANRLIAIVLIVPFIANQVTSASPIART